MYCDQNLKKKEIDSLHRQLEASIGLQAYNVRPSHLLVPHRLDQLQPQRVE